MKKPENYLYGWIIGLIYLMSWLFSTPVMSLECNLEGSQQDMNQCALDSFAKADAELNEVYQLLIAQEKNNPSVIKNLRAAQRAWIVFRNTELEAMFACEDENKRICWGSLYGSRYPAAKEALTRSRIEQLRLRLDNQPF
jgi:uncharacterized protein YecT (DUF1311 family)